MSAVSNSVNVVPVVQISELIEMKLNNELRSESELVSNCA